MRVHVKEFGNGGQFASYSCSKGGVFVVEVSDDDNCIGGFVVEYRGISAKNECITIPDCLGESVHGYIFTKVKAGEHLGFHFLDDVGIFHGISIVGVTLCCQLQRSPVQSGL
jgi:hypothetical protein